MQAFAERPILPRRALVLALALVSANTGCHKWHNLKERASGVSKFFNTSYDDPLADEKMARAEQHFSQQQYADAQTLFKELADNTRNKAELAERARFMQAECRRLRGHYPEAVDTYNRLLNDFPTGANRKEACGRMFEIAVGASERASGAGGAVLALSRWRRDFAADRNTRPARFYRIANEVPTVLLIAIVILVVVKPF